MLAMGQVLVFRLACAFMLKRTHCSRQVGSASEKALYFIVTREQPLSFRPTVADESRSVGALA